MKRGPKTAGHYHTQGTYKVSPEMRDLARRRTLAFLDAIGMAKPIGHLMQEAYMMGIRDAVSTMDQDMTTHQPMPVAGYTSQSDENVALTNELKHAEERYLRLLDKLMAVNATQSPDKFDGRFIALARTAMQEANMWAVRSIFQPQRLKLPEDAA